jgi:hypothetical protein
MAVPKEELMRQKFPSCTETRVLVSALALWMSIGGMAQAALTLTGPLNLGHNGNLLQIGSSPNNAEWGDTAALPTASAPLPDGTCGLYFANGLMAAIPEPSSLTLLGFFAIGLISYTWRVRKRAAVAEAISLGERASSAEVRLHP